MREFSTITPKSRADLRVWLQKNHDRLESVWVVIFKKDSGKKNLNTHDLTEEALCFGWIDSVPRKVDDMCFKVLMSPRKLKSPWSALNKKRVARLIKDGKMTAAGLNKINIAKKNGSWSVLEKSDRLETPDDLLAALDKDKKASAFFDQMTPSSKKTILEWIQAAKTDSTRTRRIAETVRLASLGLRANHYRDLKNKKQSKNK